MFSTFIPLPKKGDLKQCANYRTTFCSCLTCKQDHSSDDTGKDPSEDRNRNCRRTGGIPTRKGTKDQITNLGILMQKAREHQQPTLYVLYKQRKQIRSRISLSSTFSDCHALFRYQYNFVHASLKYGLNYRTASMRCSATHSYIR